MKKIQEIKEYLTTEENELLKKYQQMSDKELLEMVQKKAEELGRRPLKSEMELTWYLKERFGPWTRMLEKAGLKQVSKTQQRRKAVSRCKQQAARAKSAEKRKKTEEESE